MKRQLISHFSVILLLLGLVEGWSSHHDHHMQSKRSTIVQLFEWRFDDIAEECENFLGPYGYGGVQTSPVNECSRIDPFLENPQVRHPWWERYQPVSYKIISRSGNEKQFADMVRRCNKAGVRIYVDVVLNHMTRPVDVPSNWTGVGGSKFDSSAMVYEGVPYNQSHFNSKKKCGTNSGSIENYEDPWQSRNCNLVGLLDLDQSLPYVRQKMIEYLNKLIGHGVAGFRFDAAKHMWPEDLEYILKQTKNLSTSFFPPNQRPFVFHEVIFFGGPGTTSSEYIDIGRVTEFRYTQALQRAFHKDNENLGNLRMVGEKWGMLKADDAIAMVENHDVQRGHTGDSKLIISYRQARLLKMATAFLMAWPYGLTKMTSGYAWETHWEGKKDKNDWIGPPADKNFVIKRIESDSNMACSNGWVCEHRWRQIYAMVQFRNVVGNEPLSNWWEHYNQIAFSRGRKGFIAINNENFELFRRLQTGLPAGVYCDVISGIRTKSKGVETCTGRQIMVEADGMASIYISQTWEDPIIAIHADSILKSSC